MTVKGEKDRNTSVIAGLLKIIMTKNLNKPTGSGTKWSVEGLAIYISIDHK